MRGHADNCDNLDVPLAQSRFRGVFEAQACAEQRLAASVAVSTRKGGGPFPVLCTIGKE